MPPLKAGPRLRSKRRNRLSREKTWRAPSRRLTDGLYVFGVGSYLYMPPSLAPDPVARFDRSEEVA